MSRRGARKRQAKAKRPDLASPQPDRSVEAVGGSPGSAERSERAVPAGSLDGPLAGSQRDGRDFRGAATPEADGSQREELQQPGGRTGLSAGRLRAGPQPAGPRDEASVAATT